MDPPTLLIGIDKLRIVLSIEDKLNYLEQPLPPAPVVSCGCQHVAPLKFLCKLILAWVIKDLKEIAGLMVMTMKPEFNENIWKISMINDMLKGVRSSVCPQQGKEGNGKNKHAYAPKAKIPSPPKREDPAKDSICHECGETGYWKRNCPQYLAELLKKKKNTASGAGGGLGVFGSSQGIHGLSPIVLSYTLQHNGVVGEEKTGTLTRYVQSNDESKPLPKVLFIWDYALRLLHAILNMVPLRRSIKCIFIGYPKETMGYSFYYPTENKVLVARNAEFLENSLINQEASGSLEDLCEIIQIEEIRIFYRH
ncbi:zinc finger, CCHC-type containing protein [Tanacetum coccineum]